MPYLVLGVALLIGFLLIGRGLANADPKSLVRTLKWTGAALGGLLVVYLVATRQIEWAISAAAVTLPFLMRWRRLSQFRKGFRGPAGGQSSNVETRYLRMSLDHDSGVLDGVVVEGGFRGRKLSELGKDELVELLRECRVADEQSASVLEAYLDRTQGVGWRDGEAKDEGKKRSRAWGRGSAALTRDEAYKVLGLQPGAPPDAIKEAYHRLMRQYHPDMGGSDYLAARINEAKDMLLGD